jgi:hypothetical protein
LDPLGTTSLMSVEDILENNIHRQDNYYVDLIKKYNLYNFVALPTFGTLIIFYLAYLIRFKAGRDFFTLTTVISCIISLMSKSLLNA